MFDEVDDALRRLLRDQVVDEREVTLALEAPTKDWAARRNSPTINLYLYDIRENLGRREAGLFDVVDDDGVLVARKPFARHYSVSYLLTAWTPRPEDEHRLLGAALDALLASDALDPAYLSGGLAAWTKPIPLLVSQPIGERSLSEIWTALGGQLKPSLDLVVTVPVLCGRAIPVGPPSTQPPRFQFNGNDAGVRPIPVPAPT